MELFYKKGFIFFIEYAIIEIKRLINEGEML